jgi:hypothetical protein
MDIKSRFMLVSKKYQAQQKEIVTISHDCHPIGCSWLDVFVETNNHGRRNTLVVPFTPKETLHLVIHGMEIRIIW